MAPDTASTSCHWAFPRGHGEAVAGLIAFAVAQPAGKFVRLLVLTFVIPAIRQGENAAPNRFQPAHTAVRFLSPRKRYGVPYTGGAWVMARGPTCISALPSVVREISPVQLQERAPPLPEQAPPEQPEDNLLHE